jgi:hypothetical protein
MSDLTITFTGDYAMQVSETNLGKHCGIKCPLQSDSSVRRSADICKLLNKVEDAVHLYCGPVDLFHGQCTHVLFTCMYTILSETTAIEALKHARILMTHCIFKLR